jgi:hypothetical protein
MMACDIDLEIPLPGAGSYPRRNSAAAIQLPIPPAKGPGAEAISRRAIEATGGGRD